MPRIGILGAGAVGVLFGALIQYHSKGAHEVIFLGRETLKKEINEGGGVTISDYKGFHAKIPQSEINYTLDLEDMLSCDIILVCVKCLALQSTMKDLVKIASRHKRDSSKEKILIVTFQNGIKSLKIIQQEMSTLENNFFEVAGGIVGFGVAWKGKAEFHRSTSGLIFIERPKRLRGLDKKDEKELFYQLESAFKPGFEVGISDNIAGIMYGKLLINLSNPINALSGQTFGDMLEDRTYRMLWGAAIKEGLEVLDKAKIVPENVIMIPTRLMPKLLQTYFVFSWLRNLQKTDKKGYSSMAQDIQKKRMTEIDFINGEIVELAESVGYKAVVNIKLVEMVKQLESDAAEGRERRVTDDAKKIAKDMGLSTVWWTVECTGLLCIAVGVLLVSKFLF